MNKKLPKNYKLVLLPEMKYATTETCSIIIYAKKEKYVF
jgi:hypothetical protein